ncbi:DUF2272 domain-containing protein [Methylobacterium oryzisoli]|uniref:DUF2272 domain-containing protein n=1 Tax=Methylobacterium oryzisoli TaxID=3385502 RepID=UPI0038914549
MAFVDALVTVARREWTRWGGPAEAIDGTLVGFTNSRMEAEHPFWTFVGEYWKAVGSDLDGRDPPAWSAAFISYCFSQAGAGTGFPYHENHSIYVSKIDAGTFPGLSLADPGTAPVAVGDLLWASRTGDGCRTPPSTFAAARTELSKIRQGTAASFCSHSDIVVAVRTGEVDVIGGNVKQAVTRTTYKLDARSRIRDGRRTFVGLVKVAL